MKNHPKLELFKFQLKPKKDFSETFHGFILNEIDEEADIDDTSRILFRRILNKLGTDDAKQDTSQKMLRIVSDPLKNIHLDKKPKFIRDSDITLGVINGGPYGRDGILLNLEDEDDAEILGRHRSVLSYFFIFLYMPRDYDVGLAMIHSNRSDDSVTSVFKSFITRCFRGENYLNPIITNYCPKRFQDHFKNSSTLQSVSFKHTILENVPNNNPILEQMGEYEIQIIAKPKGHIRSEDAETVVDFISKKSIQINRLLQKTLGRFDDTHVTFKDEDSKTQRTFEWNTRDNDFVPVIYLEGKLDTMNDDGTPDLMALKRFCKKLFKEDILQEIRPDRNAQRINL